MCFIEAQAKKYIITPETSNWKVNLDVSDFFHLVKEYYDITEKANNLDLQKQQRSSNEKRKPKWPIYNGTNIGSNLQ